MLRAAPTSHVALLTRFAAWGPDRALFLAAAGAETGLPVITELMSVRDIDAVCRYNNDFIQIGARTCKFILHR